MTAGERRRARKAARAAGQPLTGELETRGSREGRTRPARRTRKPRRSSAGELGDGDRGTSPVEFSESPRGRDGLDRWARAYDQLNGAPESEEDR
jgi:hypothetical protein